MDALQSVPDLAKKKNTNVKPNMYHDVMKRNIFSLYVHIVLKMGGK